MPGIEVGTKSVELRTTDRCNEWRDAREMTQKELPLPAITLSASRCIKYVAYMDSRDPEARKVAEGRRMHAFEIRKRTGLKDGRKERLHPILAGKSDSR